ncbi:MAG TPA: sigma-70 family RNA polymerase sigma factor [Clostridia bacterium]|nr:sigma-70 family RNA polymerase sigma factor [Clostridia bacterium]
MRYAQEFEAFMKNYQNMVFSTSMRLLANESDAEDISQEVFLRAYENFGELRSSPTAGGWLKKVATNLSLNHLSRYRSRWRFFSELFAPRAGEEESEVDFPAQDDVAEAISQADRHALVEQTLQKLPATQRVPLVLYHFEGLAYEEIAQKLRVSLGKVKTDIHRAREALRKKLTLVLHEDLEHADGAGDSASTVPGETSDRPREIGGKRRA